MLLPSLTSSSMSWKSPSGRNWKVLMVKRRVWLWGEGAGLEWDSTVFGGSGSKGFGHLQSNIRFTSHIHVSKLMCIQNSGSLVPSAATSADSSLCVVLTLWMFWRTRCKEAPTQHFQSEGRQHRSAPAAPNWDLGSWGAALRDGEVSPATCAEAGDTVGSSCCSEHLIRDGCIRREKQVLLNYISQKSA